VVDRFAPEFAPIWSQAFEIEKNGIYDSIEAGRVYGRANPVHRKAACASSSSGGPTARIPRLSGRTTKP